MTVPPPRTTDASGATRGAPWREGGGAAAAHLGGQEADHLRPVGPQVKVRKRPGTHIEGTSKTCANKHHANVRENLVTHLIKCV